MARLQKDVFGPALSVGIVFTLSEVIQRREYGSLQPSQLWRYVCVSCT